MQKYWGPENGLIRLRPFSSKSNNKDLGLPFLNIRYEAQLTRYKQQLDDAERVEDELKQERRQLQRELRIISDKLENECTRIDVLQRENERLRVLRKKDLLNNSDDKLGISKSHSPLLPTNSNDIQSNSPIEDSF
ncbi:unnamed protein product [Rotaria sordida]|uniref:Uncharacterized protein n=1 Tax=Rotaria sordida TaxID=392033 RepID=A0A813SUF8_9BILA|nr:unnamed protein product [Rotaria sordida]